MKRNFYLLVLSSLCIMTSRGLFAQVTNTGTDAFGYGFSTNLATTNPAVYSWIDISSTGTRVTGLGDDNVVSSIPLGIDFKYYWNTYNSVNVGSNGYIMFGDNSLIAQGANGMPTIPFQSDGKSNFIAPLMADLTFVSSADGSPLKGAKVLYQTVGDKFVITYDSVRFWNNGATGDPVTETSGMNTFQVVLDATTNNIQVNYKSCTGPAFTGSTGVVSMGMENLTGGLGLRWRRLTSGTFNTLGLPAANSATVVRYPAASTYSFIDVQAKAVFYPDNKGGAAFTSIPKTIEAYVKNAGTVKISAPCTARVLVSDINDNAIYNQSVILDSLAQGEQRLVSFPVPLEPGDTAGNFKVRLSTSMSGDQYANNNQIFTKLIVLDSTQGSVDLKFTAARPGTVTDSRQLVGGMIFDAPYQPMVISDITADLIWPDIDGWAASNIPGVQDSLTNTRIEVYLGDGPGGSRGSLIDSFTIANETDWAAEVIGEEFGTTGTLLNKIIRFKHKLPVPYWWESNHRIYVGAIHNLKTNFIWNAPYAEVYPVGTPASGRCLEITAGVWGENRGKDSLDVALGIVGNPVVPATMNISTFNNIICGTEVFDVPFNITGGPFESSNIFKLELSQPNGSFVNATTLTTLAGTTSGTFNVSLPQGLLPGTGYKIRVVSSSPVYAGTSANLFVGAAAQPTGINGLSRVCPSDTAISFSANGSPNATAFTWTLPSGASFSTADSLREIGVDFGPVVAGQITVSARNKCGASAATAKDLSANSVSFTSNGSVLTATVSTGALAYNWYFNGSLIQGANSSTYALTESGLYCAEATFQGGCIVKSECQNIIYSSTASALAAADGMTVFPNPAGSTLNIHLGDAAIFSGQIAIRNVLGQIMENINHTSGITGIDVSSWPSGIYFVTAGLKNGGSIQKKVRIGTR
jgi:hypothetical protein